MSAFEKRGEDVIGGLSEATLGGEDLPTQCFMMAALADLAELNARGGSLRRQEPGDMRAALHAHLRRVRRAGGMYEGMRKRNKES